MVSNWHDKEQERTMKDYCHFLEHCPHHEGLCCAAGVNFRSVGQEREICAACPLADLGDVPLCEHLDVFTYLERKGVVWAVRVEAECTLKDDPSPDSRCSICPHAQRLVLTSRSDAAMLLTPVGE